MDPKRERPPENEARDSGDGFDLRVRVRPALPFAAAPALREVRFEDMSKKLRESMNY